MSIWNTTGRLAATVTLVGAGVLLGLSMAGSAPAVGTIIQQTQNAVVRDAPMPDMVPQGLFVDIAYETSRAVAFGPSRTRLFVDANSGFCSG